MLLRSNVERRVVYMFMRFIEKAGIELGDEHIAILSSNYNLPPLLISRMIERNWIFGAIYDNKSRMARMKGDVDLISDLEISIGIMKKKDPSFSLDIQKREETYCSTHSSITKSRNMAFLTKDKPLAFEEYEEVDWEDVFANPGGDYDWNFLSSHPDLTWDMVTKNPDCPWNYASMSMKDNIRAAVIYANRDLGWDYSILPRNEAVVPKLVAKMKDKPWNYGVLFSRPDFVKKMIDEKMAVSDIMHPLLFKKMNLKTKKAIENAFEGMCTYEINGRVIIPSDALSRNPAVTLDFIKANPEVRWNYTDLSANLNIPIDHLLGEWGEHMGNAISKISERPDVKWETLMKNIDIDWNIPSIAANHGFPTEMFARMFGIDRHFITTKYECTDEEAVLCSLFIRRGLAKHRVGFETLRMLFEARIVASCVKMLFKYVPMSFSKYREIYVESGASSDPKIIVHNSQASENLVSVKKFINRNNSKSVSEMKSSIAVYANKSLYEEESQWLVCNPAVMHYPHEVATIEEGLRSLALANPEIFAWRLAEKQEHLKFYLLCWLRLDYSMLSDLQKIVWEYYL